MILLFHLEYVDSIDFDFTQQQNILAKFDREISDKFYFETTLMGAINGKICSCVWLRIAGSKDEFIKCAVHPAQNYHLFFFLAEMLSAGAEEKRENCRNAKEAYMKNKKTPKKPNAFLQ